ncbi:MAG: methyltransferase domain-containing protein [Rickettsiales bacterium]
MFNHTLLLDRRRRLGKRFHKANFLHKISNDEICFRARVISDKYGKVLEVGCRGDFLEKEIIENIKFSKYNKISEIEVGDFEEKDYDLIISSLSFHYLNDFREFMLKLHKILAPKGVLIFSIFGNDTLLDFKRKIAEIEMKNIGAAYQRIIPMIRDQDISHTLNASGFTEVVVDSMRQGVVYQDLSSLARDVRLMAENNIMDSVKSKINKKVFLDLQKNYNNKVFENFDMIFATAIK